MKKRRSILDCARKYAKENGLFVVVSSSLRFPTYDFYYSQNLLFAGYIDKKMFAMGVGEEFKRLLSYDEQIGWVLMS